MARYFTSSITIPVCGRFLIYWRIKKEDTGQPRDATNIDLSMFTFSNYKFSTAVRFYRFTMADPGKGSEGSQAPTPPISDLVVY